MLSSIKKYKSVFFSVSTYVWAAIIPALITVLINPILALNLSVKDYAIIGYYTSFNLVVLPIVSFCFINYYSKIFFLKSDNERQQIKDTLVTSSLLFGGLLTLLCIGFYTIYHQFSKINLALFPYVFFSFFANLFGCYLVLYQTEKKMKGDVKGYFWVTLASAFLFALLSLLFVVVLKGEAEGRLFSILLANIIVAVYCIKKLYIRFVIHWRILRDCVSFSWPVILSSILFYALSSIDKIFLGQLNQSEEFGLYNIATQIVGYFSIVGIAVLQTFSPDIYRLTAQKNYKKLLKITLFIVVITCVLNALFLPVSELIVSLLTAGKFTTAYTYANILIFKNMAYILFFLYSDILIGLGHTKFDFLIKFVCTIIAIILYDYIITRYQFTGAAWTQSIALLLPVFLGSVLLFLLKMKKT